MTNQDPDDSLGPEPLDDSELDNALDGGFAAARNVDPAAGQSVLQQLGQKLGQKPPISLPDADPAGGTPMLKPLGPDDARAAGKYMVHGMIGQGGVGTVHRGHDTDLGRDVAMKFLHERYANEPSVLHRFIEEAQIGGQLQHPGIVPVYELGMSEGKPFFTMKMVKGVTLAKKLAARTNVAKDRRTFLSIFEDICQTMAYAHARGVVHRDLKPANIMIGSFGEVQIVDWGMGKVLQQGGVADEQFAAERRSQLSVIETVRSSGHGTQSVLGSVMGTPAYMPPEQARGDVDAMDERSDVFALGAILCEILTGEPPYVGEQRELIGMAAMAKLDDAHQRLASCGAEKDLLELTTQCLLPAPAARPESAEAIANAVQNQLASAEARAHEATVRSLALKRTQKLGIALTGVIAVALAVSLWLWSDADTQRELAETHLISFDQLSHVVHMEKSIASESALYASWPHDPDAIRKWLAGDVTRLRKALPRLRTALENLESRALPQEPQNKAELAAERRAHPRPADEVLYEYEAHRRAQAVRSGAEHVPFQLDPRVTYSVLEMNDLAWNLTNPDRAQFGREAEGLALARKAKMLAATMISDYREQFETTLMWALFSNGLDAAAIECSKAALAAAGPAGQPEFGGYLQQLLGAIAAANGNATKTTQRLAAKVAMVQNEIDQRRTWTFAADSDQFLHDTLSRLVRDITALQSTRIALAEQNLLWSRRVEELSITRHQDKWDRAIEAIAQADGTTASELYQNAPIKMIPQLGLVPIGMNPVTRLWEFYHLRSAWDGTSDPANIAIPKHHPDGTVEVTDKIGIVFVLLPGGTFTMGSQKDDPKDANFDPDSRPVPTARISITGDLPIHEVTLAPFFLARHELTLWQWARLWNGEKGLRWPAPRVAGKLWRGQMTTLANPVSMVDWTSSNELLTSHGLDLPTDAQWEYGCRSGSTTPWMCAQEDLRLYANLNDASGLNRHEKELWDDGFPVDAPVGSFRANAFGLHDVVGNMWEWCRDSYTVIGRERAGDGLRPVTAGIHSNLRVNRGGSHGRSALDGRSAHRESDTPGDKYNDMGLRASRRLTLE